MTRAPLLLAIDTATDVASVAVGTRDGIRAARSMRGARRHAAQIVALIDAALQRAGVRLDVVEGLVVGDGPGSFTGLRIGWAAARGLAHERDLTVLAVPAILGAAHAAAAGAAGPIAACFDALRGQVYGAIYAFAEERVETLVAPALFTLPGLARIAPVRPVMAVGDGAQRYADEVVAWTGRAPVPLESVPPIAASLLVLSDREGRDASGEPAYGRPAEAQAKWEAAYGRPLPHSTR